MRLLKRKRSQGSVIASMVFATLCVNTRCKTEEEGKVCWNESARWILAVKTRNAARSATSRTGSHSTQQRCPLWSRRRTSGRTSSLKTATSSLTRTESSSPLKVSLCMGSDAKRSTSSAVLSLMRMRLSFLASRSWFQSGRVRLCKSRRREVRRREGWFCSCD